MAALGTIGRNSRGAAGAVWPRQADRKGNAQIDGTANYNETPSSVRVLVYDSRMSRLYAVESAADGSFVAPNLAPGRYFLVLDGRNQKLPAAYAVDVA